MRIKSLIVWDMRFQMKYGFYFLYTVLTLIYVAALFAMPVSWREKASAILIFSDPAAMGLFFMGAIVLLEKSQQVPYAFAVSPVRVMEYIIAKVVSLCIISLVVAAILAIASNTNHLLLTLLGTALSSILFTLLGVIIAVKITSLNQFILCTMPIEMIGFVPAVLHLYGISPEWLRYYPANLCMDMISGNTPSLFGLLITFILISTLFFIACKLVFKMWKSGLC